ncbi:MAG: hypothetical protein KAG84_08755 [Bacteroidales bacterium]|nr:hypothetical protein [Bacteroidales bacterium]
MTKKILFSLVLLFLSQLVVGQNIKKAFSAIDDDNYTSARIIFNSAINNADTKAIGEYGMAIVYRNTSLRNEDMYRAFESITNAKKDFESCDEKLKKKYKKYINDVAIENEFAVIDQLLFNQVKAEDEVKAYQKHIDKCENSKYHNQVKDLRNTKAYNIAIDFNTISAYKSFCDDYPNSNEYSQAQTILFTLAWSECQAKNQKQDYQKFIDTYPNAPQVRVAKKKLKEIDYAYALKINSQFAFDSFIAKYPNSKEAHELQGKGIINSYNNVERFKSIKVCENFINLYPNSEYSARVTTIRDSLAYESAININSAEEYSSFIEKYPNAVQVPLVMEKMGKLLYSNEELQIKRKKHAIINDSIISIKIYSPDGSLTIMQEKKFDIYGNCIYNFEQLLSDYSELKSSFFDNAGDKITKEELYINNKLKSTTEYSYNNKGLKTIAKTICHLNCEDNSTILIDSFEYNDKRELLSKKEYSDSNLIESNIYSYNSKGNRIGNILKIKSADSYKHYIIKMNYNANGYLIQKTVANKDGEISKVDSYTYDGMDKIISASRYDTRGTQITTYNYNDRGLVDYEKITYKHDTSIEDIRNWEYKIKESKEETKVNKTEE